MINNLYIELNVVPRFSSNDDGGSGNDNSDGDGCGSSSGSGSIGGGGDGNDNSDNGQLSYHKEEQLGGG